VDVACPGFVSDCLETLEEIAIEMKALFLNAGGREFHYISCLNDRHEWISALADLAERNLRGWIERRPQSLKPLGIV
jgi:ferrochelatase